jgi:adenylate cyclase class IV
LKFVKDDIEIEVTDPNLFNIYERLGFEKVEKSKKK